jgi:hypothetical protein
MVYKDNDKDSKRTNNSSQRIKKLTKRADWVRQIKSSNCMVQRGEECKLSFLEVGEKVQFRARRLAISS